MLVKLTVSWLKYKIEMANKHKKSFTTSLAIREVKINTKLRLCLSPVRIRIFRKLLTRMKTKGTLKHYWQEFEVVQPLENYYE